jgi:zinc protease
LGLEIDWMMRSKHVLSAAALMAAVAGSSIAWAQALPTDPNLVTGELPNGMKYIVRKHGNPPGRAAMWIHVSTGSINEQDHERGISHYLEHMAFNGSENFPPNSVIDFFQKMGLTFGQHQNAFTSFDQTTYQLAFPDTKPETIEQGMKFFADVAGRLSLQQDQIEEERQIILEEKRARSGVGQRVQEYVLERIAPGSLVGQRLPIGVEDTLMKMNREEFVNYYNKWYVPSNMTVMVVADTDPAAVVQQIEKHFSFGDKAPAPADQDPGVRPYEADRAIVASDPELTSAEVGMMIIGPKEPPATTIELARRDLLRTLGSSAFNRRIGAKLNKGGTSYTSASAGVQTLFNAGLMRSVSASGKPEDWRAMLTELGEDVQRARLHGFSDQELDDVRKNMIAGLEQFVVQESTMPARVMLNRMNRAIADGEPIMSAQQELELAQQLLPTITGEEVSAEFSRLFEPSRVTFTAELPTTANPPTEAELVSLGRTAFDAKPEKQADEARASTLLDKLPEAGKVVESTTHESSEVISSWLSNGVRVHYRFMDIRKGQPMISISLAAGAIQETDANRGLTDVAGLAWDRPATSKLSSTNIRDLMTGKKANVRGGAGMDSLSLSVTGNPSELEEGMKLAYLLLTDPVIEPAAFEQWKKETLQAIEQRKTDPRGAMAEAMADLVYPNTDSRTHPLTAEQVNKLSLAEAQSWLRNAIVTAPIEVAVVGDIDKEQAMELVSRYLGSLPSRERISDKTLDSLRNLTKVPGPRSAEKQIPTATKLAIVLSGFYGADMDNVVDTRRMQIASRVLSSRMIQTIREKEQLAYSPGCNHRPGVDFPGFGVFVAAIPTEPAKVARLVEVVDQMYADFAKEGPTEDELTTVRRQIANTLDEQMKEPGFWSGRLGQLDYRGVKLDDIMNSAAEQQKYTAEEIKAAFNKYYKPENVMKLVVKPEGGDAEKAKPEAGVTPSAN